ncbi:hypothetical protein PPIV_ORF101 [Pike-perch iridovirus]|uniref:Uncharacterized protein n=1 Tax=Pike-perch iridovirus TaxID=575979 RepID=A0A1B2ITX8_9VIRU|nr:hypothetical protein PPIV_ORF101 [Pike-perch iridovirus]
MASSVAFSSMTWYSPLASDNLYDICVDKVHNRVLCVCHSFGCCTNAAVIWILPDFAGF